MRLEGGGVAAVDGEDVVEGAVPRVPPPLVQPLQPRALRGVLVGDGLDVGMRLLRVRQEVHGRGSRFGFGLHFLLWDCLRSLKILCLSDAPRA